MTASESRTQLSVLISEYWSTYGGFRELIRSPYLYFALFLLPLTYGLWSRPLWWDMVLSVLPNLMGISLAAFTLFLSAGSEGFRELIAGEDNEEKQSDGSPSPSPFLKTATVFLHFLLVQFFAIVFALIAKSVYSLAPFTCLEKFNGVIGPVFWSLSFFLFLYSITVVVAASFGVYEVVRWFDEFVKNKKEPK